MTTERDESAPDEVAWLRETMGAAQRDAEGAGGDEWTVTDARLIDISDAGLVEVGRHVGTLVVGGGRRIITGVPAALPHIARNGPAAVLCRIAADRKLLDDLLAERHDVNEGDCWYTCAAATEEADGGETCDDDRRGKPCDCGRDMRLARRVRLLAESWGWTEEAS